jgi:hypothetical protein
MASKMVITLVQLRSFRAKNDQHCTLERNREKESFEAKASKSHNGHTGIQATVSMLPHLSPTGVSECQAHR